MGEGLDVVNVVGSGGFDLELDLAALARDMPDVAEYAPDEHTGMHVRLTNGALVTLYRTGSYHIVGVNTQHELFEARAEFIEWLQELGIELDPDGDGFAVRNIVCTGDYGDSVNLNALAIGFGLENVEYEPEQFPGLVYRPPSGDAVVLVFASGKLVVTGITSFDSASKVFESVSSEISELLL